MRRKIVSLLVMIVCIFGTGITSVYAVTGSDIVTEARNYLGVPYVWGGASPSGFDCSGLVQYVCNRLGISMAKTTYDQIYYGTAIDYSSFKSSFNYSNLQLGDLIFFDYGGDGAPDHVGIYSGNGNMIDALNSNYYGNKVVEHSINVTGNTSVSTTKKFWQYTCGIRRVASGGNDTTPPKITGFYPSNISSSSFTINCSANETLSSAYIILYCPAGEKSISVNNINSSSFSRTINTSDYGGTGTYNLHIYVYDLAGNVSSTGSGDFQVQNLAVTGVTITNKTSSSFTVNCTTNNTISSSYFVIYGPGGEYNCSINNINSRSFSKKLYIADYGGAGTYVLHVYVTDSAGNTVGYSTHEFAAPGEYPSTPSISIHVGNENEPTTISWYSQYAKDYWVSIRNSDDTWYTSVMNTANTSWTNQFKPGTYKIHVEAVNDYGRTSYGYVSFTVPQVGTYTSTTATRSNGRIEIQTSISNLSQSAQCVMAVYSSDGALLGQAVNDANSSTNSITAYFSNYPNASYVKVFLWDSLEGMRPLTNGERIGL